MKYFRADSSVLFSPMETCECIAFLHELALTVSLIAGAVHDELLTKALGKMRPVVITPFFEKKAFFLHLRC